MVTFELIPKPGDPAVFQQALGSSITGILCPDVRERVMRHKGMILINVSHGFFGGAMQDPGIANMISSLSANFGGSTLPQFQRRLAICQLAARMAADATAPLLVHWTQSNQLIAGERFEEMAAEDAPNSLHIHPWLFGPPAPVEGKRLAGMRTFGAQHFIGREIVIEPNTLPIPANYQVILAFITVATMEDGYVIPDGDTFGPEDRSLSYRVTWNDAEAGDVPTYELTPLLHTKYGFQSDDLAPMGNAINDRAPPLDLMPEDDEEKMDLVNEWAEKRAMAEKAGAQFEVRRFAPSSQGSDPTPPPPDQSGPQPQSTTQVVALPVPSARPTSPPKSSDAQPPQPQSEQPSLNSSSGNGDAEPAISGSALRAKIFGHKQV